MSWYREGNALMEGSEKPQFPACLYGLGLVFGAPGASWSKSQLEGALNGIEEFLRVDYAVVTGVNWRWLMLRPCPNQVA